MKQQEKQFRTLLKDAYTTYLGLRSMGADTQLIMRQLVTLEEVAEKCFPQVNVNLCEARWCKENL